MAINQDTLSSSNKIYYHIGLLTIHALKLPWDTSMTTTALHILCGIGHVVPCVACSEWEKEHILIMHLTRTVVLYTVVLYSPLPTCLPTLHCEMAEGVSPSSLSEQAPLNFHCMPAAVDRTDTIEGRVLIAYWIDCVNSKLYIYCVCTM